MAFGFGGGKSSSSTGIDKQQKQWLKRLWSGGYGAMNQANQFTGQTQQFGNQLAQQGAGMIPGLTNNPFLQGLQQQAGGNPDLVASQTQNLGNQINQFSERQMNNATQTGIGAGQFGSRGEVARGLVGEAAVDSFARGSDQIMQADQQRALQAGTAGGGLMAQGIMGGLGAMPGLFGMQQQAGMAQMAPWQQYAGILGNPTVLGGASSMQGGIGGALAAGAAFL
jgi:hypothetical protein